MKSRVAALEMCSQKETLPLTGITTTSPGSSVEVPAETSDPRGKGSLGCFEGYGRVKANVSGEGVDPAYCQTKAWVWVRQRP